MASSLVYKKVAVELNSIFDNLDYNIWVKIPNNIKQFVKENQDKTYSFVYDKTKTLNEQKLHNETKEIFSELYLEYCCDIATKNELLSITEENDKKWKEKFSYERLFNNSKKEEEIIEEIEIPPIVVEKKSKFRLFIDRIKNLFNKYR